MESRHKGTPGWRPHVRRRHQHDMLIGVANLLNDLDAPCWEHVFIHTGTDYPIKTNSEMQIVMKEYRDMAFFVSATPSVPISNRIVPPLSVQGARFQGLRREGFMPRGGNIRAMKP